jgi:multidrug transporter EmrE-like cation transporter
MNKTNQIGMHNFSNLALILGGVLLNCAAQLFIRKGMLMNGEVSVNLSSISGSLLPMLKNAYLWAGMFCYGISVFLWMIVLSKVEVSYAYPFLSIGYVVAAFIGYKFFGESLSAIRVAGIAVICVGVFLISRS